LERHGIKTIQLKTIYSWKGTGNKALEFSTSPPSVVNYAYSNTNNIANAFDWGIQGGNSSAFAEIWSSWWDKPMSPERASGNYTFGSIVLSDTGKYELKITSTGCNWFVKIGTN
jgi:hypothetical protein